jgi:hypothetical protein
MWQGRGGGPSTDTAWCVEGVQNNMAKALSFFFVGFPVPPLIFPKISGTTQAKVDECDTLSRLDCFFYRYLARKAIQKVKGRAKQRR